MNMTKKVLLWLQLWNVMFIPEKPRKEMIGYSRSKEDFREKIILKYNSEIMKELVLVTTPDCIKCKFIKPKLEEWCKENWYKFKEMEYWKGMDEVTSVPCAMIGEDIILDYEWIIELITDKKKFY